MMAALDRHLKKVNYSFSIARDKQFSSSREVLEGIARQLRLAGKGKVPNRARSLSSDEIETLWNCGQLGDQNPRSLINTVWWNNCMYFGVRGREEHHTMLLEDFELKKDSSGKTYLTYQEGLTKTRKGGLNFKPRIIYPRMYATDDDKCPVNFFRKFVSRRPVNLRHSGAFYLSVIDNPKTDVWYKTLPMGVHTINNILKNMKKKSPLSSNITNRKITNHSARKTLVRKLRENGFQKCEIKNITGHASEKGLDPYDSGDDFELQQMSNVIGGKRKQLHVEQQPPQHQSLVGSNNRKTNEYFQMFSQFFKSMINTNDFSPNFSLGIDTEPKSFPSGTICHHPQSFSLKPDSQRNGNVFNNCTITINNNDSDNSTAKSHRRKRIMIESDSDYSQEG